MQTERHLYELETPLPETIEEARLIIKFARTECASMSATLRHTLAENKALNENLSATQARCTELIMRARAIQKAGRAYLGSKFGTDEHLVAFEDFREELEVQV